MIQFVFSSSARSDRIGIARTGNVDVVTLENSAGTGGCQYNLLSGGALERYVIVNSTTGNVDWSGCWGTYDSYGPYDEPSDLTIMNVRTPVSPTAAQVSLTLTAIYF